MAVNILGPITQDMTTLKVACSHPTTPASGDPVRIGAFCGLATGAEDSDGNTVVAIGLTKVSVSVKAVNGGGNSAVAVGDALYYVDADTPVLSKKTSGTFFGYALEAITSGSTATIKVLMVGANHS